MESPLITREDIQIVTVLLQHTSLGNVNDLSKGCESLKQSHAHGLVQWAYERLTSAPKFFDLTTIDLTYGEAFTIYSDIDLTEVPPDLTIPATLLPIAKHRQRVR